jgi:predicted dehydrogenase
MNRILFLTLFIVAACSVPEKKEMKKPIRLITLDPGHFHAALIQKSMYPMVDSTVYVYAPDSPDVQGHLARIKAYNNRPEIPTRWNEQVYIGPDFIEKMLSDQQQPAGGQIGVVVISGNNLKKTEYIKRSIASGFHVLADKPMAINKANFDTLRSAFDEAKKNKVLLYDIMTERYEITNILQRALSMLPELFGTLEKGTPDNPAVTKESVHYFYKYVSGQVLVRPPWFLDVSQQGEGLTDITTHLVDLVQWECFPELALDYTHDIQILSALRWPTEISRSQFNTVTRQNGFPDFLKKDIVRDSILRVFSNGEIHYQIRGVNAKVSVTWAYQAPEGTGDTHYSIMSGTQARLIIRQGAEQQFKPTLYIESVNPQDASNENKVITQFKTIEVNYPGVSLKKIKAGWEVVIPDRYKEGHEAHFAMVTGKFLDFLDKGSLPAWEVPNMIAKYYTTTTALEVAKTTFEKK